MLDRLKAFIDGQSEKSKEEEDTNLEELWKQKRDFVEHALFEYTKYLDAIFSLDKQSYRGRFAELQEIKLEELKNKASSTSNRDVPPEVPNDWVDEDLQIEIFKLFLSPDYTPPDNPVGIQVHLSSLYLFYAYLARTMPEIPFTAALRIDYALARLVGHAKLAAAFIHEKGHDRDRILNGIKGRAKKIDDTKQYVCMIYQNIETRELTLNKIAQNIQREFEDQKKKKLIPEGIKRPATNTIKTYLFADDQIKQNFEKRGRFWISKR